MRTLQIGKIPFTAARIRMQPFARLTKRLAQLLGADPKALLHTKHLKGIEYRHDCDEIWDLTRRLATPFAVSSFHPNKKTAVRNDRTAV
jgi:hypothetical protein